MNWQPNVVGGQGRCPKKLFHGTSLANARSIVRVGLIPYRPPTEGMIEIEPPIGVYLTPAWWSARTAAEWHVEDGLVLVVKVKGLDLVHVKGWGGLTVPTFVSLDMIPPERIVKALNVDGDVVWRRK